MAEFPVPEILRVPLESISLSVKAAREDEDVKVRGLLPDARYSVNLRRCVLGILKPSY
jgi:HrpA-like RNA helicase